jgi:hypothetical protein
MPSARADEAEADVLDLADDRRIGGGRRWRCSRWRRLSVAREGDRDQGQQ